MDDQALAALYRGATALVYPSLAEGFGLPIVEAMALGCPVITSDRSSMKEIAEGAAYLVDPEDVRAIRSSLLHLAKEPKRREDLAAAGRERAARYTWEATGRRLFDLLRELATTG